MEAIIEAEGLTKIHKKVLEGERLTKEDGITLFNSSNLPVLGYLANIVRERLNGKETYYIYNQHINYSNICKNLCKFCAFGKKRTSSKAFEMSLEDIENEVKARLHEPITEIHVVGGCHPDLPYEFYLEMLRRIKGVRPGVHIQAFTCVEIAHIAEKGGRTIEKTLEDLVDAGLGSIPGGGAEVFSPRIRQRLCPKKLSGEKWLEVAKTAHGMGIKSNATMLYGHIETIEERLDHLIALRSAQDETRGFMCFIPLSFHPRNTALESIVPAGGVDDLKTIAVSRLILDNFPHIKAYWIMLGTKVAQVALSFGADDFDGTVLEEKITHMAGAETEKALSRDAIEHMIRAAGSIPVERDTLYKKLR